MNRFASKTSLTDSITSSRMNKGDHTHVIIQNPKSNDGVMKYLTLPIEHLVTFGRPLKVNDLVTYKTDLKSRGTNRGKILLFGTEDDCSEQVQILSSVSEENDIGTGDHGVAQTFDTCDLSPFDDPSPRRVLNAKGETKKNTDKQQYPCSLTKQSVQTNSNDPSHIRSIKQKQSNNDILNKNRGKDKSQSTKISDGKSLNNNQMNTAKSRKSVDTSVSPHGNTFSPDPATDRTAANQKTLDQMLKKVVVVGKIAGSKSSITYEKKDETPKQSSSNSTKTSSSSKDFPAQKTTTTTTSASSSSSSFSSKPSSFTTSKHQPAQNKGFDLVDDYDDNDVHVDKQQVNIDKVALDLGIGDKDYYLKEYNHLYNENQKLKGDFDKLVLEHRRLKQNTIPMPNEAVRNWIVLVARLLTPTPQVDVKSIADALKVEVSRLTGCRRKTATHTVREIIKLIYKPHELETKRGTDVSPNMKHLIKEFVEYLHGVILEERPFKEAINGVFRNTSSIKNKHDRLIAAVEENRVEYDNDPSTTCADEAEDDCNDLDCQEENDEDEYEAYI